MVYYITFISIVSIKLWACFIVWSACIIIWRVFLIMWCAVFVIWCAFFRRHILCFMRRSFHYLVYYAVSLCLIWIELFMISCTISVIRCILFIIYMLLLMECTFFNNMLGNFAYVVSTFHDATPISVMLSFCYAFSLLSVWFSSCGTHTLHCSAYFSLCSVSFSICGA